MRSPGLALRVLRLSNESLEQEPSSDLCLIDCRDLDDAVERLRASDMDWKSMPQAIVCRVGDGTEETVRQLRRVAPALPIVLQVANENEDEVERLLRLGVQECVSDHESLASAVRRAVARQQNLVLLAAESDRRRRLLKRKNRRLARMCQQAQKFVDNVSHEFRTPLTVIKEYTSLLHEGLVGDVNAEQRRMLQVVEDRADDLTTMVDDMLDVSKLEAGLLGAWRKPCTVADVFDHVRASLERKAAVKGVELQFEIPAGLPEIYCDAEKAGRVVMNLAVNAIKFCGDPGLVQIKAVGGGERPELVIEVSDNGPGIAPESLATIFERFKQLAPTCRSSTKGFGLGLNIARELAALNYGELRVASELGVGSTFSVSLPVSDPVEVLRRHVNHLHRCRPSGVELSLLSVRIAESTTHELADGVDAFLNFLLRREDLLFRLASREWLLALPLPATGLEKYLAQMTQALKDANRNRPHGPLPPLEPELLGVWSTATESEQALDAVRNLSIGDLCLA